MQLARFPVHASDYTKEDSIHKQAKAVYESLPDKTTPIARYWYNRAITALEMRDRIGEAFGIRKLL